VKLTLPLGNYRYEIERGPEFVRKTGELEIVDKQKTIVTVGLSRIADLAAQGWYSGELHVHRPIADVPLLMQAEDLHVAPVITWWNGKNLWRERPLPEQTLVRFDDDRFYDVMAGEDERTGGALLYFGLRRPLDLPGNRRAHPEFPSPMKFVKEARRHDNVFIEIEKPFWWDVPIWLASGQVDSIGIANNHMCRSVMFEDEAWGRPRDTKRLPSPLGNGRWSQEIYYHVLNCGLRVPPSAGSASGVLKNPVGYNRVYVNTGTEFTYERWWQGLKAGRSFVTNGPLLLCRAEGQLPGHVFSVDNKQDVINISLELSVTSNDVLREFEIIQNGKVVQRVPIAGKSAERKTKISFSQSGWFLVRTIANEPRTFRFASTAPFYVELGEENSRISRASAEFFLQWLAERRNNVEQSVSDLDQRQSVLVHHDNAEKFWRHLLAKANAD
jgi:hypothetical protein